MPCLHLGWAAMGLISECFTELAWTLNVPYIRRLSRMDVVDIHVLVKLDRGVGDNCVARQPSRVMLATRNTFDNVIDKLVEEIRGVS